MSRPLPEGYLGAEARITSGPAPELVEAGYALETADAITDHLAMMTSPGWAAQRPDSAEALRGSGQTLYLHSSDEPDLGEAGEWFVERGAQGTEEPACRRPIRRGEC